MRPTDECTRALALFAKECLWVLRILFRLPGCKDQGFFKRVIGGRIGGIIGIPIPVTLPFTINTKTGPWWTPFPSKC